MDALNVWPYPKFDVDVKEMEEDWNEDPYEVEEDGEEIVLFELANQQSISHSHQISFENNVTHHDVPSNNRNRYES